MPKSIQIYSHLPHLSPVWLHLPATQHPHSGGETQVTLEFRQIISEMHIKMLLGNNSESLKEAQLHSGNKTWVHIFKVGFTDFEHLFQLKVH